MILKTSIYLDNSHATKPSGMAIAKMLPFSHDKWGIPSQPHEAGQELMAPLRSSYETLYAKLKADPDDLVVFCNSGAEAINQVLFSVYTDRTLSTGRNHFMAGKSDEAPAIMSAGRLEKLGGVATLVKVDPQSIIDAITPRTVLLSLSLGNGLTGTLAPIEEIAPVLKERGILLHLDISHVFGKMDIEPMADFITLDGSLIHGPHSSALLWVKKGIKLDPFIMGGLDQAGHRGAPVDVGLLAGLAEAVKESVEAIDYVSTETARLRKKLEKGIEKIGGKILFKDKPRLPHITAAVFPNIPNEALLFRLNKDNLLASMGGGNLQQIGFVLHALDIPESDAQCALSFSLSRETTEEEIDRACQLLERNVKELEKVTL